MDYDSKDYRRDYRQVQSDTTWTAWRVLLWVAIACVVLTVAGLVLRPLFVGSALIEKSTDPDHIINNYEEFQSIYNAAVKLNTDLGTIRAVPDNDAMFAQFSKNAMITAKKQQLNRWVEEYNAKSKMINRNLWKSKDLPYQMNVDDFSNYGGAAK